MAAPADVDEERHQLTEPFLSALNVALMKARATVVDEDCAVVAADTVVVLDGTPLGKPADADDATRMLLDLRGRAHEVLTGVVVRAADGREWGGVVSTRVVMRAYGNAAISDYVARGEPFDKAGGYAVQDALFQPVERLDGCYLNVVGLPLCAVLAGLAALSIDVTTPARDPRPPCDLCRAGATLVTIGCSVS